MLSQKIRRAFLDYFKSKGHAIIPSSPVFPKDDPTLLFTNAGMNQFKDLFLGKDKRDYTRAATSQKCVRAGGKHNDLENVGHTSRHLTFFEMLGNFSFGDYSKKEAIEMAFEVTTKVFKFDLDKVWITIFETDDEAFELWKAFVPENRIVRMGEESNFWSMGDTGPCGPCSELYYDRGKEFCPSATSPLDDKTGERFLEFWNLVFMQYNMSKDGTRTPLPKPCVDTGAGLERVLSLIEGAPSLYQTDIFMHLILAIEKISGIKYTNQPAFHVIADHLRTLCFAISDGAIPSNEGRGYVLRRILRRAVRYGKQQLGFEQPFLGTLLPALIESMGEDFPELAKMQKTTEEVLFTEEEAFFRTLKRGGSLLFDVIEKTKKTGKNTISGEDAFKLKDTYGFPIEELYLVAKDSGLSVDNEGFALCEEKAKELSRGARVAVSQEASSSVYEAFLKEAKATEFIGYTETEDQCTVVGILVNGAFASEIKEGEEGQIFLDRTPFYAESGGQVGDIGKIIASANQSFVVSDTQSPYKGLTAHIGKMHIGSLRLKDTVMARIDSPRRLLIQNNHTATHLLHFALCEILGPHVAQAGSLVASDLLRFDFNHLKALTDEEIRAIERLVNDKIRGNHAVNYFNFSREEVKNLPNVKQIFDNKYGSTVRLVDIGFSKELCGGTHVNYLGRIGLFRIVSESSVSAGVRRIEAVTGKLAENFAYSQEDLLKEVGLLLKIKNPSLTIEKMRQLLDTQAQLQSKLKSLLQLSLNKTAEQLLAKKTSSFLVEKVDIEADLLGDLATKLFEKAPEMVLLLFAEKEEHCSFIVRCSDSLSKKIKAGDIAKEILPFIQGKGGGNALVAQGGGPNAKGIKDAIAAFKQKYGS